jgi:hypothetical protein
MLVELLQPFSDAIHQLEGDKPYQAACHHVLVLLRKHVEDWASKHRTQGLQADAACPITGRALGTMDRRLDASPGGSVAPVYNAVYSAAFLADPFFAEVESTSHGLLCCAPMLDEKLMTAAESVVERLGGQKAVSQFSCLFSQGYPKKMQSFVAGLARQRQHDDEPLLLGNKHARREVPTAAERLKSMA